MPWQTPPSFTDGTVSSAGDMNIVQNNLNYLKAQADVCGGSAFWGYTDVYTIGADTWRTIWIGQILHQANNLYSKISIQSLWHDKNCQIRLVYNDVVLDTKTHVHQHGVDDDWAMIASPIDLASLGLTKYQWYVVKVQTKALPGIWGKYIARVQALYECII